MNLRHFILAFLLGILGTTALAQDLRITIWDKDTRQPVYLAYVNVYSQTHAIQNTLQTDERGVAIVKPEAYPLTIEVASLGYEPYTKTLLSAPVDNNINITLVKKFSTINEVVVTGLSTPEKMKDALSVYQVIPRAQIQSMGAVTLDDALKNQLNMRISNDGILGSSLSMQGMSGNKVKILIDGVPVNGREAGNINLSQLNMNNVERIEMIQGPMSVVYGTDAVGGIINIITRKESKPFGINIGTYLESIGKYNFDGNITFGLKDHHQFTIGGGRNYFEGWKYIDTVVDYNGSTYLPQRSMYFNPVEQYIGNLAYAYSAPSGFKLNFASDFLNEHVTDKGNVKSWNPAGSSALDDYYNTTRSMNRLSLDGKLGKTGHWQSLNGLNIYFRNRMRYSTDLVTLEETPTTDRDTSTFTDITLRGSYNNTFRKLSYTAGYDILLQDATSLKIEGHSKQIQDYAAFATVAMPFANDKLTAQVGLRAAYNSVYTPPVLPNFNLMYTPAKNVQLRASYSQGFRAPSLKELYLSFIDNNHHITGNTDLKAETSQHVQVSGSYQAYAKQTDYLQFIVTGYYNDVTNGIVLVNERPWDSTSIDYKYANLTHQNNAIATVQADGQWKDIHFQLGYSFSHTFAEEEYYDAFDAQEFTATLQYSWRKPGINFNLFYKFTGKQPFLTPNIDGTASYNGTQEAYQTADASVEKRFWDKRLHLIVGVKNIFDIQNLKTTGVQAGGGAHGTGAAQGIGAGFLPRSFFTSIRFNIDK